MQPLILFDFDGTLVDSVDAMLESLNEVVLTRGLEATFSRKDFQSSTAPALLREAGLWFWQVPGLVADFREHFHKKMPQVNMHVGLKSLLRELSVHADLGVVSSNEEDNVREVLAREGVEELFSWVVSSSYFSKSKHLRRLRREAVVDKFFCVYVGDESRDVAAARRAGFASCAVSWGLQGSQALLRVRPDMLAQSSKELEHLLKAWLVSRRG